MKNNLLALGGAVVGAIVGYLVFGWMLRQGFHGLALVGGGVGLGAGVSRSKGVWVAVVCGVIGLAAAIFTEWSKLPFAVDESLGYFLTHLTSLPVPTLLMLAVGTVVAFWVPFRRKGS